MTPKEDVLASNDALWGRVMWRPDAGMFNTPKAAVEPPEAGGDDADEVWSLARQRRGRYQKNVAVVQFVNKFSKRHGRAPSHPELRAVFPAISKAAAQRYRVAA